MSGQDLLLELEGKVQLLDKALRQVKDRGRTWAQSEHDYRAALCLKILEERDKGTPVTIISDICRGTPSIAKAKLNRDISEVMYKAAMEACNVYKLQLKVLENQIDREYRG